MKSWLGFVIKILFAMIAFSQKSIGIEDVKKISKLFNNTTPSVDWTSATLSPSFDLITVPESVPTSLPSTLPSKINPMLSSEQSKILQSSNLPVRKPFSFIAPKKKSRFCKKSKKNSSLSNQSKKESRSNTLQTFNKNLPSTSNNMVSKTNNEELNSKLNTVTNNALLTFTQAFYKMNVSKIGDNFDQTTEDLINYNFGIANEDVWLNSTQLITKCGYQFEEYTVETPDGYILYIVRIPGFGPPVLIMHGVFSSSDDFLTSGCEKSLPFVMYNAGYDVWLGNARGNTYSKQHVSIPHTDNKFWDFSWHEIAIYDAPTMIDFILEKTSENKLYYIGHSQGTTTIFVLCSEKPEYNDKIIMQAMLSPIAWMNHMYAPLPQVVSQLMGNSAFLDETIGSGEFKLSGEASKVIVSVLCGSSSAASAVCNPIQSSMTGFNPEQKNFTLYPAQMSHQPASSASKQLVHYSQGIKTGKFQQFDYGEEKNQIKYGRPTPPEYDVKKITSDVALFYSDNDWMSSPVDVERLASQLPNLKYYHKIPYYDHQDFMWGKNADELAYFKIIELFDQYQ